MKKLIIFFVLLSVIGCNSQKINLTGKFDVVLDNEIEAVLTIKQEETKLTGFFQWNETRSGREIAGSVYAFTGYIRYNRKLKSANVQITVKGKETLYVLQGDASDSDSILGTLKQSPAAKSELRHYTEETQSWMAIRK